MAYKKYIKRGGKTYGPYVYHSKKINGRVTSQYLGKYEKKNKINILIPVIIGIIFLFSLFIVLDKKTESLTGIKNFLSKELHFTGLAIEDNSTSNDSGMISSDSNQTSVSNETVSSDNNVTDENTTIVNETQNSENITNETIFINNETSNNSIENVTPDINITTNETAVTNLTVENITIQTVQYQAVLGKPVKWKKQITPESEGNITIYIPKDAGNITITEVKEDNQNDITPQSSITGGVIGANKRIGFFEWLSNIFGKITGNDIASNQEEQTTENKTVEIPINDASATYTVSYETPAPYSAEKDTDNGKIVTITGPDTIHYENVLSFTNLDENFKVTNPSQVKIYWEEEKTYLTPTSVQDTDGNGIYDYVEWLTPHLSNQTFDIIIEISKAEHLDNNKNFISDIYPQVSALDDNWSEEIPSGDYVRVTFQQNLTNKNDITLYPKTISGNPSIEVYEQNGNNPVAEFANITSNDYNKVLLTDLQSESQNVFDLEVTGGSIEIDYIVDPIAQPGGGAIGGQVELKAQNCTHLVNSTTITFAGYTTSCFGTYPSSCSTGAGDRLSCNDTGIEWVNASQGRYAGVRTHISNASIISCSTVNQVFACYEWWSAGMNLTNCYVAISNGSKESNVTTACPGGIPNTGMTCVNVTSNLAWSCNSFFGVAAQNKSYIRTVVNITNTTGTAASRNITIDLLAFNVTYTTETVPPNISITFPLNMTNSSNILLNVNYTARDSGGLSSCWWSNDSYTINNTLTNCSTNITGISWASGIHNITIWANDTSNNVNWNATSFIIDTIPPLISILYPINMTNSSDTGLDINYSVADNIGGTGIFSCWYSNDSYSVNSTP
ncbi:MAG TPA: hypothetical protein VMC80_03275, partial [Patescibacteria group bacterium]|nr:hypothetical protein [Patescibacteria group bacterium]